jgi:DNA-binding PadR family transcriptional regulator
MTRKAIYLDPMDIDDLSDVLPLSPAALHILLCLSGGPRHGYAIVKEVALQSAGQYKLGPGTLYDNLRKLIEQGIVDEAPRPKGDDDPRRRYYRLTGFGQRVLEADVKRLKIVVREASLRLRRLSAAKI